MNFVPELPYHTEHHIPNRGEWFPRRLLRAYGFGRYSCLPKIKLTPDELTVAAQFVRGYPNPVIIRDVQRVKTGDRDMPDGFFQKIVDSNPKHTFISCGLSAKHVAGSNLSALKNTVHLNDLPIRMVAAIYHLVGKYVGVDTGAYYLMLAVKGRCDVWIWPPNNSHGYRAEENCFPEDSRGFGPDQVLNYIPLGQKLAHSIVGLSYPFWHE